MKRPHRLLSSPIGLVGLSLALAACKQNNLAFLNTVRLNDVTDMIDEGVMIGAGASPEVADKGRKYTKRKMPW